ncbi:MAG TPA: hypothetical protein PLS50_05295, partial [Candidatus Dojkabacteria bacterium]|nr:hypothetical protein [Candidatus Dojkabacteria bacterium]
ISYPQHSVNHTCRSPSLKPSNFEPDFPKTTHDSSMSQFIEQEAEDFNLWIVSEEDPQAFQTAPQGFFQPDKRLPQRLPREK